MVPTCQQQQATAKHRRVSQRPQKKVENRHPCGSRSFELAVLACCLETKVDTVHTLHDGQRWHASMQGAMALTPSPLLTEINI